MNISRRHMLAITAAAGISGRASADTRIEKLDPALDNIISTSEPIRELAAGMGGPAGPVEGPVWWKEGGYLLFSDIQASKRMKYTPGQGVTLFQDKTNQANRLTRDLQGRLLACEHVLASDGDYDSLFRNLRVSSGAHEPISPRTSDSLMERGCRLDITKATPW